MKKTLLNLRIVLPHPATMFFLLTLAVILLSWIFDAYGMHVRHPQTGELLYVQSLLNPEGIRWLLRHVITNFTSFAPLGMVMVTMFGIGVAQHSGFLDACIRSGIRGRMKPQNVVLAVIVLSVLSNVVGDAGYIVVMPVAATLFHSVGLNPVGGIIVSYVSVACGYSANLLLSTLDSLLSVKTLEAADTASLSQGYIGPFGNYYFFSVSAVMLVILIYYVTQRSLLPSLCTYEGEIQSVGYKRLSRKERRAMLVALLVGVIYAFIIWGATFSSWGILRSVSGGLINSPFLEGFLFLFSLGVGLMGVTYGFASGVYRTDSDVIEGLTQPMRLLGVYFVIVFFAAQMFACFEYSQLDKYLAIAGADMLSTVQSGGLVTLLLFILFTALVNILMVSATAKWNFMAFIFVPMFADMGVSPDWVQCAFRIGDSSTNALTPFMFYLPLALAFMRQYDKRATYASLLSYSWKFAFYVLVVWSMLFILWYMFDLPLGF